MDPDRLVIGVFGALAGAAAGSFCVTAALRRAEGGSAVLGRSRCDGCGLPLGFAATAPLVSFAWRGGRCEACGAAIWLGHPFGEGAGAFAGLAVALLAPPTEWPAWSVGLGAALYGAAYDARTQRIPDAVSVLILSAGLFAAWTAHALPEAAATGAIVGALTLCAVVGFQSIVGRPGLGLGDVKLIAALSVWTGPVLSPLALAAAAALALGWLAARGQLRAGTRIAFAPFLCLGFWSLALGRAAA
jgi:leader peptidase (prepilin peptidase)/N-methyltransferase